MTSTYPLLYLVLKRISIRPSNWLAAISFAASVYPSFLLYSNFAISENLFTPLFLLVLLLCARYLERPRATTALALGIAATAAYAVHNRGLSVIAVLVIFCIFLGYKKRVPWPSVVMLAAIAILGIAIIGQLRHLLEAKFPPTLFPRADLSSVLTESGINLIGMVLLGQIVYLTGTTFGLYLNGIFYLAFGCRNLSPEPKLASSQQVRRDLIAFILAIQVCVLVGAAIFVSTLDPLSRPDYILMGRYTEPLVPVIMAAGLLLITEAGRWIAVRRLAFVSMGSCVLVLVAGMLVLGPAINWDWLEGPAPRANFFSFLPLYRAINVNSLAPLLAIPCLLAAFALAGGLLRLPAVVIWSIAAVFSLEAMFYTSQDLRSMESLPAYNPATGSVTRIGTLLKTSAVAGPVDVDAGVWDSFDFSNWQLFSGKRHFSVFRGHVAAKDLSHLVIAGKDWGGSEPGYRDAGCEDNGSACLWVKSR